MNKKENEDLQRQHMKFKIGGDGVKFVQPEQMHTYIFASSMCLKISLRPKDL